MTVSRITKLAAIAASLAAFSAHAYTIDFGTSWPAAFVDPGVGAYATAPYDLVLEARNSSPGNSFSTETQIAALLNSVLGTTTWTKDDVNKYGKPAELGVPDSKGKIDGYFEVVPGWDYLIVQYDGPNGGSVVIDLSGNAAKVPFDSAPIWGSGDQYAVSHYSLVGPVAQVPDGGATLTLLGLSLVGLAVIRRK